MNRILSVAFREYRATVSTKGFLIGMLLGPLIAVSAIALMPILLNKSAPKVTGEVAIIDRSGKVAARVEKLFAADEVAKRQAKRKQAMENMFDKKAQQLPVNDAQAEMAKQQLAAMATGSSLTIKVLPGDADPEVEKKPIATADGKATDGAARRLVLAVIPAETVNGKPGANPAEPESAYATYEMYTAPKLDFEVQEDINRQIDRAIVDARIDSGGIDAGRVRALMTAPINDVKTVTAAGERSAGAAVSGIFIPMAFMMLIWIGAFTSGNFLLTSLIEEKSNRVMELLLSAVSPMQLMTGKILGQMLVGLSIMAFYMTLGGGSLVAYKLTHLVDPINLVYLMVYFVIAFMLIAAMMASIGSAVSDVREAQSLMGPVMIVLIIPMALWMPIQRNPNSMFAQVLSFIPPVSPFAMILRLTGSEKVPAWQIPVSMVVGLGAGAVFIWAAAKIFRVGVLMYGKPPSLLGLIKWVRYA